MHGHQHDAFSGRRCHGQHAQRAHHGFRHPFVGGHPHGFGAGGRARRGDIRTAALRLLAEQPMHGYQIIQELGARSEGAWTPSAGSIYPALQLLADEGLVTAEETGGKKVFSLTEAGIAAVAEFADQPAPWEDAAASGTGAGAFRESIGRLVVAAGQIAKSGDEAQRTAAIEILNDARKKLYAILAED